MTAPYDFEGQTGYEWKIHGRKDGSPVEIFAQGENTDMPEYTRGDTVSLEFVFWADSRYSAANGATYGGTTGFTYGGGTGAQYGIAGATQFLGHIDRYEALREFGDYAGAAQAETALNGDVWFTEFIAADAPVDSLVLALEPGVELTATPGIWGLVESVDDATVYPESVAYLSMTVTVLAELTEYDSRTAMENDLKQTP